MKRLIIVGSPRTSGRSAHLAEMLFEVNIDEHPEDELFLVPLSEVEVGPCIGCNACRKTSGVVLKGDDGKEITVQRHRCVFDDDMQTLYDLIDDADEITVVSPVYFSGAPAQLKCLLDRLQPYFWARMAAKKKAKAAAKGNSIATANEKVKAATKKGPKKGSPEEPGRAKQADSAEGIAGVAADSLKGNKAVAGKGLEKRPLNLHVIGEGGDPHGYDALVSEIRSSFACAGFRLERLLDWVGKIDEAGEITAEARETTFDTAGKKQRPKLDLHSRQGR